MTFLGFGQYSDLTLKTKTLHSYAYVNVYDTKVYHQSYYGCLINCTV